MRAVDLDVDEPHNLVKSRRRYHAVVATARRMEGSGPNADANGGV
jgi:hypothetical protein